MSCLSGQVLAQESGLSIRKIAKQYEDQRDFNNAILYYEQALPLLEKSDDKTPYFEVIRDLSYNYLDVSAFDKAQQIIELGIVELETQFPDSFLLIHPKLYHTAGQVYLDNSQFNKARKANRRAMKLYSNIEDVKERKKFTSYMINNIGSTFNQERKIDSALYYFEKALPLKIEALGSSSPSTQRTLRNISRIYQDWGQLDKAIEIQNQALDAAIKEESKVGEAKAYNGLSQMYQRKKDFETSKKYISKSFEIFKALGPTYKEDLAYSYHQMGNVLETEGAHKESIQWYGEAKKLLREIFKRASYQEGISTMTLAKAFNYMAKQEEEDPTFDYEGWSPSRLRQQSLDYYSENIRLFNESVGPNHIRFIELWLSRGNCYIDGGDTLNAHSDFLKAYEMAYAKTPEKSYDRALSSLNLAATTAEIDSAIALCQEGLWELSNDWSFESEGDNPSPNQVFYDNWSLILMGKKADFLIKKRAKTGDKSPLSNALKTIRSSDQLLDDSRESLLTNSAKIYLAEHGHRLYAQGLEICHQLENENSLSDAFRFMEKSKVLVLLESIQKGKHLAGNLVPDSISSKILRISEEITGLQSQQNKLYNSDSLATLGAQIFDLENERKKIQDGISSRFPIVDKTSQLIQDITLESIQGKLKENEVIYEYLEADLSLYILKIQTNNAQLFKVQKDIYSNQLDSLLSLISDPDIALKQSNSPKVWKTFKRQSHFLFKKFLPDFDAEEIIIIPDGKLNFLPFDMLLTDPDNQEVINYSRLPYLLKKASIRYTFSTALILADLGKQTTPNEGVLAMAPSYLENTKSLIPQLARSGFTELNFTQDEVKSIASMLPTTQLLAENATLKAFKNRASQFKVVHLAMHAYTDEEDPMMSGMIFSNTSTSDDHILHAYEIYSMNLNTDLVVMSACNTSLGQYKEGEGIMSLSRAFKHAGVKNIVSTLWQANDEAISKLMTSFYGFLSEGESQATAIRKAKLHYLENSDHTFPHYWAAPILVSGQLHSDAIIGNKWWLWVGFILVLIGGFYFFSRMRNTPI